MRRDRDLEARLRKVEHQVQNIGSIVAVVAAALPAYMAYELAYRTFGLEPWLCWIIFAAAGASVIALIWISYFANRG
jgi:hypothetical protein